MIKLLEKLIRNRDFLIITWGVGRRFQASNFKANIAYLSKEIMISDVIVVNAHTKTEIGAITDQLITAHSGGRFAIFISKKKKSHGIIVFL